MYLSSPGRLIKRLSQEKPAASFTPRLDRIAMHIRYCIAISRSTGITDLLVIPVFQHAYLIIPRRCMVELEPSSFFSSYTRRLKYCALTSFYPVPWFHFRSNIDQTRLTKSPASTTFIDFTNNLLRNTWNVYKTAQTISGAYRIIKQKRSLYHASAAI